MFQYAAWVCAVGEEFRAILFTCDGHTDRISGHGNRAIANQPIKAQARNVQHVVRVEIHRFSLAQTRTVLGGAQVTIEQFSLRIPIDRHLCRHQRIQPQHLAFPVSDDLCVSVAP